MEVRRHSVVTPHESLIIVQNIICERVDRGTKFSSAPNWARYRVVWIRIKPATRPAAATTLFLHRLLPDIYKYLTSTPYYPLEYITWYSAKSMSPLYLGICLELLGLPTAKTSCCCGGRFRGYELKWTESSSEKRSKDRTNMLSILRFYVLLRKNLHPPQLAHQNILSGIPAKKSQKSAPRLSETI